MEMSPVTIEKGERRRKEAPGTKIPSRIEPGGQKIVISSG